MAFRAPSVWKWMIGRVGESRMLATSTSPKRKPFAPIAAMEDAEYSDQQRRGVKGEFVPVHVALGMIMLSGTLGLHTAKQQLAHSPTVRVRKSRRETLPEVEEPDSVLEEAQNFIAKSFFRKVAHVQDFPQIVPDPTRGDPLAHLHAETLKSVGVEPKLH